MLDDYLRNHDGVITRAQALSAGLSDDAISRRVRSGHWQRCAPGVFFVDDRPFTDSARVRSAVWSYGPAATASGLAAAWWHGVTRYPPDSVEVTVPKVSNHRKRDGIRVRRRDLLSSDIVERNGLRVTALPLSVIEAATRRRGGATLMDAALQRHVELKQLWDAHLRNKGRHGSPAARILLLSAADGARSEAERLLLKLLRHNNITGWTANHPVAGYKIDVVFQAARLAIEVDGWAFHSSADDFENDRNRQNIISLHGYQILRFTWLDLTEYPDRVLAEIRNALRLRHSA
ncbi:type IV toxin-antitoxin system AbiEi family antitoxin domain-containing protein [Mycolicibacterium sp. 050232]|uniref:type IV toxin-antitoxin system AbiEi family antitoxin domain-containing protein n=1 Tax=Mycolicibacterium sp. 050232 TaxID=3113982 RepID=UPI002E2E23B0|nr:type IV toxin-antitoxin system AbiEi family antitoxin domain-containing protein [Mycolicibacterium sp. 050232]MED5815920.1 type IV toxin-antitoxin system AbiEi family antitoxin domain-containing protein [Mycolicibacterium sp. 050232]